NLHVLDALAAAELFLILLLETRLADELTGLIAVLRHFGELALADLADVPDEAAHGLTVGIDALRRRLDDQAGKILMVLLEHRHGVEGRVLNDDGRAVAIATEPADCILE